MALLSFCEQTFPPFHLEMEKKLQREIRIESNCKVCSKSYGLMLQYETLTQLYVRSTGRCQHSQEKIVLTSYFNVAFIKMFETGTRNNI